MSVQKCSEEVGEIYPLIIPEGIDEACTANNNDQIELEQSYYCRLQCIVGFAQSQVPYQRCAAHIDRKRSTGTSTLEKAYCKGAVSMILRRNSFRCRLTWLRTLRQLPTLAEQTCTFEISAITTENYDLNDCKDLTADSGTFNLNAMEGKTSCTLECDRGFEKSGSGLHVCLKNANEPQGRKVATSFTCRGTALPR